MAVARLSDCPRDFSAAQTAPRSERLPGLAGFCNSVFFIWRFSCCNGAGIAISLRSSFSEEVRAAGTRWKSLAKIFNGLVILTTKHFLYFRQLHLITLTKHFIKLCKFIKRKCNLLR